MRNSPRYRPLKFVFVQVCHARSARIAHQPPRPPRRLERLQRPLPTRERLRPAGRTSRRLPGPSLARRRPLQRPRWVICVKKHSFRIKLTCLAIPPHRSRTQTLTPRPGGEPLGPCTGALGRGRRRACVLSLWSSARITRAKLSSEPHFGTFLSHAFNFEWHSSEHHTGGFGASSGESARAPWAFVDAVPARDPPQHAI